MHPCLEESETAVKSLLLKINNRGCVMRGYGSKYRIFTVQQWKMVGPSIFRFKQLFHIGFYSRQQPISHDEAQLTQFKTTLSEKRKAVWNF